MASFAYGHETRPASVQLALPTRIRVASFRTTPGRLRCSPGHDRSPGHTLRRRSPAKSLRDGRSPHFASCSRPRSSPPRRHPVHTQLDESLRISQNFHDLTLGGHPKLSELPTEPADCRFVNTGRAQNFTPTDDGTGRNLDSGCRVASATSVSSRLQQGSRSQTGAGPPPRHCRSRGGSAYHQPSFTPSYCTKQASSVQLARRHRWHVRHTRHRARSCRQPHRQA
jgi:hypothetical protein